MAALLLVLAGAAAGCNTVGFYTQAAKGQFQLLARAKKIEKLLQDPDTPESLKERFQLLKELRRFAETELKLPVNGHYRKYVDVHRPYVVWNVQAAPEFSMEPKTWWYPLVGRLDYRGYFFQPSATNYAAALRQRGYDVAVGGVQAYSTLGWFKDPVLNTFIFEPDAELAEIIFHELTHQKLFARGDTDFNEAFATTVAQESTRRWLKTRQDAAACAEYEAYLKRNEEFVRVVMKTRSQLEKLFGDTLDKDGKVQATDRKKGVAPEEMRSDKQRIYAELRNALRDLKANGDGPSEYDYWFEADINNAHLNSVAAYFDLVPGFEQLLALNGGDLGEFYAAARRLAKKPKKERHERLRTLARAAPEQNVTARSLSGRSFQIQAAPSTQGHGAR